MLYSTLWSIGLACIVTALPIAHLPCPEIRGDFWIDQQDLYPESADWDPVNCKLYLSSTYNGTLVVYNPYTNTTDVVNLPGITDWTNSTYAEYHVDGIDYDYHSGNIWIAAASSNAFDSTNTGNYTAANYTGPNNVLRYDTRSQKIVSDISLSSVQQTFLEKTGNQTNGFQDMAEDNNGHSYVIGTFGNSIVKIPAGSSEASLWYWPQVYNITYGFGGLFAYGNKLVVSDTHTGGLVTFDTSDPIPTAVQVPLQDLPSDYRPLMADGLFAPRKYEGRIALWSDDFNGTSVYGSKDGWNTATYLGLVPNDSPAANGSFTTATFEIGQSVFALVEFFQFRLPVEPRQSFPFFDITMKVDDIVRKAGYA